MIGDFDPEDEFDSTDPPEFQLGVLERVVEDLQLFPDEPRRNYRRDDALRIITYLRGRRDMDIPRLEEIRENLEALT